MNRYFRGLIVGMVWGVVFGLILRNHDAPDVAYGVLLAALTGVGLLDLARWWVVGDLD